VDVMVFHQKVAVAQTDVSLLVDRNFTSPAVASSPTLGRAVGPGAGGTRYALNSS
jgi:hypothetical protein